MTQIDAGNGWRINNASPDGWYAVNTITGQVLGPFHSWIEANKTISQSDCVCDCCGENPCVCPPDTTAKEVYSEHYAGL